MRITWHLSAEEIRLRGGAIRHHISLSPMWATVELPTIAWFASSDTWRLHCYVDDGSDYRGYRGLVFVK